MKKPTVKSVQSSILSRALSLRMNSLLLLLLLAFGLMPTPASAISNEICLEPFGSSSGEIEQQALIGCEEPPLPKPSPGVPPSLSVPATADNVSYTVSWGLATGTVTRYELEQKRSTASAYSIVYTGLSRTKNITNQAPGTWSYRVRACNNNGCSGYRLGNHAVVVTDPNAGGGGGNPPPVPPPGTAPPHNPSAGAIAGQFRVDESGQANYSIQIATVAGRGGVAPQIGLSYSSQGGNGLLGVGWSVTGQSAITRCRRTWEQDGINAAVDLTANDRFCLNGQRLMSISGTYGAHGSKYKTEIDSQVEVTAYYGATGNPAYFKVTAKDGSISEYGNTSDSKVMSNAAGQTSKITTWAQSKFTDNATLGNSYSYRYETNNSTQAFLLKEINYTGTSSNSILFEYESRPDKTIGWSATGSRFESNQRLLRVDSKSGAQIIRSYHLTYGLDTVSLLESLEECVGSVCLKPTAFNWEKIQKGYNSYYNSATPYRGFSEGVKAQPIDINGDGLQDVAYNSDGRIMVGRSTGNNLVYTIAKTQDTEYHGFWEQLDYNGDGKTDLMYIRRWSGLYYWTISLSNGSSFSGGDINTGIKVHNGAQAERMRVMDINGDALPDLVYQKTDTSLFYVKYMQLSTTGVRSWGGETTLLFSATGSGLGIPSDWFPSGIKLKDIQAVDFNGDGIVDVFAKTKFNKRVWQQCDYTCDSGEESGWYLTPAGTRWVLYAGEHYQQNNINAIRYNPYYVMSTASNMPTEERHYKILDINGDGLADIMYRRTDAKWQLLLNKGQGNFGGLTSTAPIYIGALTYDDYIQFGDYNHDGKTDLIYINGSNNLYVKPWTGTAFGSAVSLGLPSRDRKVATRIFMDANGDGITDYFNLEVRSSRLYMSKTTLKKNHVITRIDNGLGSETEITYRSLTDSNVYAKGVGAEDMDFGNGSPVFDVVSPMYVVERAKSTSPGITGSTASTFDANATATVRYRYRGARMQSGGRGFLGFEVLATLDPQTGVETVTTYKQQFPYTGRPHSTVRSLVGTDAWPNPSGVASGGGSGGCPDCLPPPCKPSNAGSCVLDSYNVQQMLPKLSSNGSKQTSTVAQKASPSSSTSDGSIELSKAVNDWQFKDLLNGVSFPYLEESTETSHVLNQNLPSVIPASYSGYGTTKVSTVVTSNTYDDHANPTLIDVVTKNQYGSQIHRKITRNSYGSSTVYQRYGRLTQAIVDTYTTSSSSYQRRVSQFQYHPVSLLLSKEIIEPSGNVLEKLITVYRRDGYGNILQKTTCSSDVTNCGSNTTQHTLNSSYPNWINRWAKTTYASGTYPINSINTLGHITQKVISRNHLGQVLIAEDIYGTRSTNQYDVFGGLIHSYNDTGAKQWTGKVLHNDDYGIKLRQVTTTLGAPTKIQYSDALGRAVRTGVEGFDGEYIYKDTLTDTQGRTKLSSQPYKESSYPQYWSKSDFDVLGRIVKTTQPDGFYNTMAHNGLTLISTIGINDSRINYGNGLTKTETKNALGQLTNITDALGGSIDYVYDAYGKLRFMHSKNAAQNKTITTQIQYDRMGRKSKTIDPDMGSWTYSYNALGELTSQTDAKNQQTYSYYDPLGRMVRRLDKNSSGTIVGDSRWTFDNVKGHLKEVRNLKDGNYKELYFYDEFGRNDQKHTTVDGRLYQQETVFDGIGRVHSSRSLIGSLQGLPIAVNHYNSRGYLAYIKNSADANRILWQALYTDNYGNVVNSRSDNGRYESTQSFNPKTGLVESHTVRRVGGAIHQQLHYQWDALGNLRKRKDTALMWAEETFQYDKLNRLVRTSYDKIVGVGGSNPADKTYQYDSFGNLTVKEGVSNSYDTTTNAGPHALSKAGSTSYYYDKNGNQTSGGGRYLTYATFGKPTQITKGNAKVQFNYNPSRSRYKKLSYQSNILKETKITAGGVEVIKTVATNKTEVRSYLAGAILKNIYTGSSNNPTKTRSYLFKDHLGSTDTVLTPNGNSDTLTKMSFSSFGERSYRGWDRVLPLSYTPALLAITDKGYTGHEQLDDVGLIHMNGRVYDPKLGRFMSADPHIQAPTDTQSLNRYSYVLNNPLSATDPSGYFFKSLKKFVKKYWKPIVAAVAAYFTFGAISGMVQIYMEGVASMCFASMPVAAGIAGGAAAGFVAGAITTGTLRGAVSGSLAGGITGGVAAFFGNAYTLGRVATDGITNGAAVELTGGKFKDGFRMGLAVSLVTYINVKLRQFELKHSQGTPGQVGESPGFRGVSGKVGGGRIVDKYWKESGAELFLEDGGTIEGAFELYIKHDDVKISPLGGHQGGQGIMFSKKLTYSPGSLQDYLVEGFGGTHDALNHWYHYNPNGTAIARDGAGYWFGEALNAVNVGIAAPIVVPSLVPDYMRYQLYNESRRRRK